ncbi:mucin-2 [Procambarus clarkii]|uniref:mucin-2 n=1 Tax=Procambarus clarkii TaxID=6728 RepID=UPI0037449CA8
MVASTNISLLSPPRPSHPYPPLLPLYIPLPFPRLSHLPSFPTPSYAPPLPSVTPAPLVFTTTYSPSISFTSSFPPITTNVHSPPIPSTTHSPRIPTTSYSPPISTPTHTPPILTTSHNPLTPNSSPPVHTSTTTYSPPVVSTTSSPPAANTTPRPPFVSYSPPLPHYHVLLRASYHAYLTRHRDPCDHHLECRLPPDTRQQRTVPPKVDKGGNAPSGALPHGSTRGPRPLNSLHQGLSIAEEVYPDTILRGTSGSTTGKLTTTTTEVLQGTPFSRFPGTDANDDDHVLSLFNNRKGNASSVDDKSLFSGVHRGRKSFSFSSSILGGRHDQDWHPIIPFNTIPQAPPPHQLQELQVSPSPHPLSPPSTVSNRKPPMPQLVRGDGLPLPPSSEGLVTSPVPPQPAGFPGGPSPDPGGPRGHVTAEDLAKLPAYLREAPTCATNRSFCLMPLGYPREVAASLVSTHREEMSEITRVLANLPHHELDLSSALQQFPYIDTSVECESEERTVYLSWSRDLLGSWFVIMQTPPFTQPVNVTTCSSEARKKGCRPLLQAQPLLALHPRDPQPRPFLFDFPLPVACVFVGPLQSASSSPVTVVNTPADQQLLTSPLPDQSVTSPSADSDQDSFLLSGMPHTASRQTVDSLTSPTSELPLSLSVTSSFYHSVPFLPMTSPSSQQVPPFAMTSPSSQPIPSAFGTSQAFPRALLPLRPAMLLHDVSVEMDILNDEVVAKVTRNAGCTDLCQTQFFMLSLSFILLVQR